MCESHSAKTSWYMFMALLGGERSPCGDDERPASPRILSCPSPTNGDKGRAVGTALPMPLAGRAWWTRHWEDGDVNGRSSWSWKSLSSKWVSGLAGRMDRALACCSKR